MSVTPIWIGSPNSRTRLGSVRFITLHWMVGNLRGTDQIFQKVHGTATHYGIENGVVHQYVTEERSAPGTGSNLAIPYDITIEHAGGWLLPDGTRFKPSEATHETSAQLCADISRRHGLGKLVVGVNVFPHKHFVATACPGTLDLEWIASRANELLGHPSAPAATSGAAVLGHNASSWSTFQIQEALIRLNYDLGPWGADGGYGLFTTKAVHKLELDYGLSVDIGIAGPQVVGKLAELTGIPAPAPAAAKPATPAAPKFPLPQGSYFGPKNGPKRSVSGYFSHRDDLKMYQQQMQNRGWKIKVDGLYGDETGDVTEAFQKEKKLTVDRWIGPETWAAAWTAPITK